MPPSPAGNAGPAGGYLLSGSFPAVLEKLASRYGAVRVGFSGAFTTEELAAPSARPAMSRPLSAGSSAFLTGLDEAGRIPPAHRHAARAAVGTPFSGRISNCCPCLPAGRPSGPSSSALLTDFTAQDYARLGEILGVPRQPRSPHPADAFARRMGPGQRHLFGHGSPQAAVQTFLNVSPTDEQASSASEP